MPKKIKKDKNLPIVLLEDIPGLGNYGEIKKVKRGFVAFLIRSKKAIVINKRNFKKLENLKLIAEKNKEEALKRINHLKEKIESLIYTAELKIGPNKEVYNSITINDIKNFLKKNEININKNQIELDKPLKEVGEFLISINLGYGIKANLKIVINENKINL